MPWPSVMGKLLLSPRGRGRGPRPAREGEGALAPESARMVARRGHQPPHPPIAAAMGPALSRKGRGKYVLPSSRLLRQRRREAVAVEVVLGDAEPEVRFLEELEPRRVD